MLNPYYGTAGDAILNFSRKSISAIHHYNKCIGYSNNYEYTRSTSYVRRDKQ